MAELYRGIVVPHPYFQFTKSGKGMLKFKMRLENHPSKRIPVLVFGAPAEKNQDLEPGELVVVSGKWKENEFNGETTTELVLGDYGGNIRRVGQKTKEITSRSKTDPHECLVGEEAIRSEEPEDDPRDPGFTDDDWWNQKEDLFRALRLNIGQYE